MLGEGIETIVKGFKSKNVTKFSSKLVYKYKWNS